MALEEPEVKRLAKILRAKGSRSKKPKGWKAAPVSRREYPKPDRNLTGVRLPKNLRGQKPPLTLESSPWRKKP